MQTYKEMMFPILKLFSDRKNILAMMYINLLHSTFL
ncbi:Uncharacterised protein [Rodentibacter pneumotropicus]|uniref:Uncharacterized protein n=1 Tax=Rodentibacter pneumotropicus TaxID=758 RepID=A0A3S5ES70_9PAST|nr:Uncharacterised protein [Rodentibacter pneumotropicus]